MFLLVIGERGDLAVERLTQNLEHMGAIPVPHLYIQFVLAIFRHFRNKTCHIHKLKILFTKGLMSSTLYALCICSSGSYTIHNFLAFCMGLILNQFKSTPGPSILTLDRNDSHSIIQLYVLSVIGPSEYNWHFSFAPNVHRCYLTF